MEELRQQEMYVNTVMLLLAGIQTTKLFLKYVSLYVVIVKNKETKHERMETQMMEMDAIITAQ